MIWIYIGISGVFISIILSVKEFLIVNRSFKRRIIIKSESIHAWVVSGNAHISVVSAYRASLEMLNCAVMLAAAISYAYEEMYLSIFLFSILIGIQVYVMYMAYSYGKATKNLP
jgi:hypothetical protein